MTGRLVYTGRTRTVTVRDLPRAYAMAGDEVTEARILPSVQAVLTAEHGPAFEVLTSRGWRFVVRADELAVTR